MRDKGQKSREKTKVDFDTEDQVLFPINFVIKKPYSSEMFQDIPLQCPYLVNCSLQKIPDHAPCAKNKANFIYFFTVTHFWC